MSKAPPERCEKNIARSTSPAISLLSGTARCAASALMRDSSEVGLCGLIAASMRCISAITASMAASPARGSSLHSSTLIAVPMIASSRRSQAPTAAAGRRAKSNWNWPGRVEANSMRSLRGRNFRRLVGSGWGPTVTATGDATGDGPCGVASRCIRPPAGCVRVLRPAQHWVGSSGVKPVTDGPADNPETGAVKVRFGKTIPMRRARRRNARVASCHEFAPRTRGGRLTCP